MKLFLTSAGIKNATLRKALIALLGKPISESTALCIPTAMHAARGGSEHAWRFVTGTGGTPLTGLGWKSIGLLELTALPTIEAEHWISLVRETDALLVGGGDAVYLAHWMRASGLADLLPSLHDTVWVGISAGSMVMTPEIGHDFMRWTPPDGVDRCLNLVDFSIFPHLDHADLPDNCMAGAERWAAGLGNPAYAIDDETAIQVVDGTVEVISEGHWRLFSSP